MAKKKKRGMPSKTCWNCGTVMHAKKTSCPSCGKPQKKKDGPAPAPAPKYKRRQKAVELMADPELKPKNQPHREPPVQIGLRTSIDMLVLARDFVDQYHDGDPETALGELHTVGKLIEQCGGYESCKSAVEAIQRMRRTAKEEEPIPTESAVSASLKRLKGNPPPAKK